MYQLHVQKNMSRYENTSSNILKLVQGWFLRIMETQWLAELTDIQVNPTTLNPALIFGQRKYTKLIDVLLLSYKEDVLYMVTGAWLVLLLIYTQHAHHITTLLNANTQ